MIVFVVVVFNPCSRYIAAAVGDSVAVVTAANDVGGVESHI